MEAFCGKWKTNGKIENLDAYAKALNLTEVQKKMIEKPYTYEFSCAGGSATYTMTIDGGPPITESVKIGEKTKTNSHYRGEMDVIMRMEGDTLVTIQTFADGTQTLKSQIKGGELKVDTTFNGVTMTAYLERA